MKNIFNLFDKFKVLLFTILVLTLSCNPNSSKSLLTNQNNGIKLTSSDTSIVNIFNWAVKTSRNYVGDENDPVGPWYEAALPDREAFCIRDVSHQCRGSEVIGLGIQNLNMFTKFVENISETRDYCSYWEMNRYNKPAPIDYTSDKDFFYTLNANFDIIDACFKLYLWTGDSTYIYDERFDKFFRLTLNEYVERWQLQFDKILNRESLINVPNPLPANVRYISQRGIPSYIESVPNLVVTSDLVAMIYNGYMLYSRIQKIKNNAELSKKYEKIALEYKQLFEKKWWDESTDTYYNYWVKGNKFIKGGTNMYPLWYNIIDIPERITGYLNAGSPADQHIEHLSYLPMLYYRYGYNEQAYNFIQKIFNHPRREYPEASSGIIESVVMGMMGLEASVVDNTIFTCSRLSGKKEWMTIENVPTFAGLISVKHESGTKTYLANKGKKDVIWRFLFKGNFTKINVDEKDVKANLFIDKLGKEFSYAEVTVKPNNQSIASVVSK